MSTRTASGFALAALVAAGAVLLVQPTALAHVTVTADKAEPGGYARVAFRMPNERADAATTRLEVVFPPEHRFASVSVLPVPGWTATVRKEPVDPPIVSGEHKVTEAVTAVVWEGGTVQPGQFQEFPVSLGRLPETPGALVFKALQTYSSGEVVRWIDAPGDGAEHPAPSLSVKAAASPATVPPTPAADLTGRVLGGAGLLAGLAALGLASVRLRRPAVPAPRREKAVARV
jgi:periplasmic copper chaperone A